MLDTLKRKLNPFNWFRKEQENQKDSPVPILREPGDEPHPVWRLQRDMERLFERFWRDFPLLPEVGVLRPRLDIAETDRSYEIEVEVPGVSKDDIQVECQNDVLFIRGRKETRSETSDRHYHRIERSYGAFERVLCLPEDADPDNLKATFKNGVLAISLGRKPSALATRIPIGEPG